MRRRRDTARFDGTTRRSAASTWSDFALTISSSTPRAISEFALEFTTRSSRKGEKWKLGMLIRTFRVLVAVALFSFCSLSFEKSPRHDAYVPRFEAELSQFCEKLAMDLGRKVRRGRERLAQEVEVTPPISAEKSEQLSVLEEKIKKLLEQIEVLGEAGQVDEAEELMKKVEVLNAEKVVLTQQSDKMLMLAQEKKMALCETCGSFLIANDAAERTQSHVTGKQHIGYGMVRDFISEFKAAKEKAREEDRLKREKEAEERRKQREREYENRVRANDLGGRERYEDRGRERDWYRDRRGERERSHERSVRGSREGWRGSDWGHNQYRNGRDRDRERHRDRNDDLSHDKARGRSRSHSPIRNGSSRSRSSDRSN